MKTHEDLPPITLMRRSKKSLLCVMCAACVVGGCACSYGLDLKYYKYLPASVQRHVCRDATQAHPELVKQLQAIAERYVKLIQAELTALGKREQVLAGIGQTQIELGGVKETGKVLCGLSFVKNTHVVEVPSGMVQEPDKDGCVLTVWVHNILASSPPQRQTDKSDWFLVHEIEIHASYLLRLSENNRKFGKDLRALIEQRIKEMCDEMKKLQTAEDKAADAF